MKEQKNASQKESYLPHAITFISGASYGFTTVVVGQPLDTIKTRMQGLSKGSSNVSTSGAIKVFSDLFKAEGLRGLYRGGVPLAIGGSLMRSAQFGVSAEAKNFLMRNEIPTFNILGFVDSNVLLAGIAGGVGRALVEIPTDFFKIRRQVQHDLNQKLNLSQIWRETLNGSAVTMTRNTILFGSFIVYVDISKKAVQEGLVPKILCSDDGNGLKPFAKGAICSNLAWVTSWPLDVIKTQRQSGNYKGNGGLLLMKKNFENGLLFRGILPGLLRSTLANGSSMVVYEYVHSTLSNIFGFADDLLMVCRRLKEHSSTVMEKSHLEVK